eukprot:TRINITY_DN8296_c0_g1_i7.p1 TRINITY_DN8296_c0_g1~~TRINITY_DN8296_c0_g1_i7.p1  ORF type:complete len:322 (+),score=49.12 TRINITY_DN8296_c0_g1_i7:1996-2961(+)
MKQSAPTQNIPAYQPYATPYSSTIAPTYQAYVPEPVPPAVAPCAPNPQPQPYQPTAFEYYRTSGRGGYAHSLDQYSSYTVGEEKKEGLQPQVLSRGFEPKRRRGRQGPSAAQQPEQYAQPSVPFPPFLPGTRFPQHNSYYPYPYPYDYATQWYGYNYGSAAYMQPPVAPVRPPVGEDMKWTAEKAQERQRSNSDATKEEEKPGSERNNSIDSSECSSTTEFKELDKSQNNDRSKRGYKKYKQKMKWVPKKEKSEPGIKPTTESEQNTESGSFLNKVKAAHNMQMLGVATDKETLLAEGQRTYYNTPRRPGPAGTKDSTTSH